MLFNVNAALSAIGLATPEPDKTEKASKRAETDAILAARVDADAEIVKAWAVTCAAFAKLGATVAQLPGVLLFAPTVYDLRSIGHTWQDTTKDLVYVSHNRANRALKAIAQVFGDTLVIASAKNGGDVIRTTPETKANGAGGAIMTERARQHAITWAEANAAKEVAELVKALTALAKAGDQTGAATYIEQYQANAAKEANTDALDTAQLERYFADRSKPASKRRPMAEILGVTATDDANDDDDETGDDETSE
jgi:hypothetical protein